MTSFHIKLLAITFMLVDHIGVLLFPDIGILRTIGRLAFPLFAWQLAISATHTSNPRRFLSRLLIGGLISQPIYSWFSILAGHDPWFGNIFFTLALGLITILLLQQSTTRWGRAGIVLAATSIALVIPIDYGAAGLLSIVAFYFTKDNPKMAFIVQSIIFGAYSAWIWWESRSFGISPSALSQPIAPLAVAIISRYNHQRGPRLTYLFYIFYPAHLLLLSLIFIYFH